MSIYQGQQKLHMPRVPLIVMLAENEPKDEIEDHSEAVFQYGCRVFTRYYCSTICLPTDNSWESQPLDSPCKLLRHMPDD